MCSSHRTHCDLHDDPDGFSPQLLDWIEASNVPCLPEACWAPEALGSPRHPESPLTATLASAKHRAPTWEDIPWQG